ncbi:MAG: DUF115 domain-containing protein [Promethearchaeota archaeon]|nr:MAG: DUF115 domain-containing protein [Candidatus Lokiarchaeota archaeon]
MDFYEEFKDWYNTIIEDFNFDAQKDIFAREFLSNIIKEKKNWNIDAILSSFQDFLSKKEVILVYGCGISLELTIDFLLKNDINLNNKNILNIAADGASRLLRERKIEIGAIFSDLDGITANEFIYSDYIIVHAHGDNIDKLKRFEKEILEFRNIIFTCQVEPDDNIINTGGFTDGDRILYFLRSMLLPSQSIFLIGMDFTNKVGKYSKLGYQKNHKASKRKQKKLKYAEQLIDWLGKCITNEIYYVNSQKPSQRYENLDLKQFLKKIKQL